MPKIKQDAIDTERSFREFVAKLCEEFTTYSGPEQRADERRETPPIPVLVQPLDDQYEPEGESFVAVIRNVCNSGIGLMYGDNIDAKYIEIQTVAPSGAVLKCVMEVRHCTAAGVMIGASFVEAKPPVIL